MTPTNNMSAGCGAHCAGAPPPHAPPHSPFMNTSAPDTPTPSQPLLLLLVMLYSQRIIFFPNTTIKQMSFCCWMKKLHPWKILLRLSLGVQRLQFNLNRGQRAGPVDVDSESDNINPVVNMIKIFNHDNMYSMDVIGLFSKSLPDCSYVDEESWEEA